MLPASTLQPGRRPEPSAARLRRLAALIALSLLAAASQVDAASASAGEALYRQGALPSGAQLRAMRAGGAALQGRDAACTSCHRRSGLGSTEGRITVPPIVGAYLFAPPGRSLEELGVPFADTARINREPYSDETLARAIREGIDPNGRVLNYLMPRYPLDDAVMAELITYLKGMTVAPAPGVTPGVLHFATIVTPDADPLKRRGMLEVMQRYFADKNAAVERTRAPTLYSSHRVMFRVARRWQLHVWELTGAPSTWHEQLRRHLASEPVFAVIAGVGGKDWQPVQSFCEEQALPCLFPNVEAPAGREHDFYTVYFSRGVLLEAGLIARELAEVGDVRRVIQVFRAEDVGAQAARALQAAAAGSTQQLVSRVLKAGDPAQELAAVVRDAGADDALVLWLRPQDLEGLPARPQRVRRIWISGEMGGLERSPLPAGWRAATHMAYPVDLPGQRAVRVDYALSWFRIRAIPVVAQQVQVDTYVACGLVSETLSHMVDAFVRDYLMERIEMALDHRVLTGYYPHLTLAPGQRYASKGGYIVRFSDPEGPRLTAVGDWTTP